VVTVIVWGTDQAVNFEKSGARGERGKLGEIVAGGEHGTFTPDDDDPDGRVRLGAGKSVSQSGIHRAGERVHLVRPDQRERENALGGMDGDVIGHGFSRGFRPQDGGNGCAKIVSCTNYIVRARNKVKPPYQERDQMKDQKKTRLIFLLNIAQRAVDRWIESSADGSAALSAAQGGTMFFLSRNDGAFIGDVAQALKIGAPAMSGLANRLEQAGYLVRKRDELDGRTIRLFQTEEGRAAGQRAKAALGALNARLSDGFSEDEMAVVGRWLESLPQRLATEDLQKSQA
jgi:DNA-binding MarR family transcriptional regulator